MVTYSIHESSDGTWHVCRAGSTLLRGLRLAEAIRLAREAARDEFRRSGRPTTVEMPGDQPSDPIRLAYNALAAAPPGHQVA